MKQQQLEEQVRKLESQVAYYEMTLKNIARRDKTIISKQGVIKFTGWAELTREKYAEVIEMSKVTLHEYGVKVRKSDKL
ncbi:hypothetical protein ZAINNY_255 [Bacillus phage Zainny]|uniref:hypothetical protein n=1 Tax=Bacillus phage Zuko TaxID=1805956 RepID=UPI0007A773B9|nr:hypothetical protein BI001_gp127 [Bacillus phage Zuko]AMW62458.1 hypothetical protein ZUKO_251 [Bacillus phage Zuko]ASR79159.1 hypothetical protein ZAINNY_255 [Bacillus phage Zainny]